MAKKEKKDLACSCYYLTPFSLALFLVRAAVRLTGDLASESASAAVKVGP